MAADFLGRILERKRREVARRGRRASAVAPDDDGADRSARAVAALRRPRAEAPRVVAELKLESPSRGVLRVRVPGEIARIARSYEAAGAAAVSVLADGPGFGGTPLDVRRVSRAVSVPVLFKEFVLDERQVELARAMGASLVLLLVRALEPSALARLVTAVRGRGMAPLVEAASPDELARALDTGAEIVGVNARDLATFEVDEARALEALEAVPADRVAVYMSGIAGPEDLARVARGRADAALVGEGLMRAPDPGEKLRALLGADG
jgi:indole-3-glycerol phosphate synthase